MSEKAPMSGKEKSGWTAAALLALLTFVAYPAAVVSSEAPAKSKSVTAEDSMPPSDAVRHKSRRATNPTWDACREAGCDPMPPKYEHKTKRDDSI